MLDKVKAGWDVLQKGQCVLDPARLKNHQINANAIAAFILSLVYAAKVFFDVDIPVNETAAIAIGGGVLAIANILLTMATSKKVGLSSGPVPNPESQSGDYRG